jgi:hypothetical protein
MFAILKKFLEGKLPEVTPHTVKELPASDADEILRLGEVTEDNVVEKKCPYGDYDSCHYRTRKVKCDGKTYQVVHVTPSEYVSVSSYGGGIESGSTRKPTGACKDPTQFFSAEILPDG